MHFLALCAFSLWTYDTLTLDYTCHRQLLLQSVLTNDPVHMLRRWPFSVAFQRWLLSWQSPCECRNRPCCLVSVGHWVVHSECVYLHCMANSTDQCPLLAASPMMHGLMHTACRMVQHACHDPTVGRRRLHDPLLLLQAWPPRQPLAAGTSGGSLRPHVLACHWPGACAATPISCGRSAELKRSGSATSSPGYRTATCRAVLQQHRRLSWLPAKVVAADCGWHAGTQYK